MLVRDNKDTKQNSDSKTYDTLFAMFLQDRDDASTEVVAEYFWDKW